MKKYWILLAAITGAQTHCFDRLTKVALISAIHQANVPTAEKIVQPFLKVDNLASYEIKEFLADFPELNSIVLQLIAESSVDANSRFHPVNAAKIGIAGAAFFAAGMGIGKKVIKLFKPVGGYTLVPKNTWNALSISKWIGWVMLSALGAQQIWHVVNNSELHQRRANLIAIKEVLHKAKQTLSGYKG